MNINLDLYFFCAIVSLSVIVILDLLLLAPKRKNKQVEVQSVLVELARSMLPILLIVFTVRAFAYEVRIIPSGSLKPTLLVGDYILVNKFYYGLRLPIVGTKILAVYEPQRGDIVVFREPTSHPRDLIKRVIGLPGDHVSYINKTIYINGQRINQTFERFTLDQEDDQEPLKVRQMEENLFGVNHGIFQIVNRPGTNFYDVVVPVGSYFMMGDNRDDSADSRFWGFLPEKNIIGKATRIILSFDKLSSPLRFNRTLKKIS